MTFLVQTLLVRQHKVLLGRWHTGAFKGRVTGLLGSAPGASPEVAATRICRPHLGPVEAQRLRRRGIFQFEEWGLRVLAHSQLGARKTQVWYERVLFKDHRLRGTFSFQGTSLVKHTLEQVSAEEGLCESLNQNVEENGLLRAVHG
eukprot:g2647.t1